MDSDRRMRVENRVSEVAIADIALPSMREFITYWESIRADRFAPSWQAFDMLQLRPASIPGLIVVDVLRDPLKFLVRYWGTAHVAAKGYEKTGMLVGEPPNYRGDAAFDEYRKVVETKRPVAIKGFVLFPEYDHAPFDIFIVRLPLSDDGTEVHNIVSLALWENASGRKPRPAFP